MKDRLVGSPSWILGVRIAAILIFLGFTSAAFLVNRNNDQWPIGFMVLIGGAFGFLLKIGPFGFTCSFRDLFHGQFINLMHLCLMLTFATLSISLVMRLKSDSLRPLFQLQNAFFSLPGRPIGVSLAVGAFIFGIGMQLGSGCASGTLVGLGEGFVKSIVVVVFFITGATLAIQDDFYDWWNKWPQTDPIQIEWWITVVIVFALFVCCLTIECVKFVRSKGRQGGLISSLHEIHSVMISEPEKKSKTWVVHLKLVFVDLGLALTVTVWFLCIGSTIGVMGAFSQIGSRIVGLCGGHPQEWKAWNGRLPPNLMSVPQVLSDSSIVIGALIAAAIMGNFGSSQKNNWVELIRGIFGGLCMGVGGTLARGCNIGGMLSGITASAPSGLIWMVAAILGSGAVVGVDVLIARLHSKPFVTNFDILSSY